MKYIFPRTILVAFFAFSFPAVFSQDITKQTAIEHAILNEKDNFYYVNFAKYRSLSPGLPVGIFDSGTGGLTVLEAIVNYDKNNNVSSKPGADSIADFANEKFIYLADQANMPYGNYYAAGKSDLLIEHIIKDAQFLLSNKYYANDSEKKYSTDKQPIKALVIACNTATAYGKKHIEDFIRKTGIDLHIIGVIDAGARGALATFRKDEDGAIGVMATVGTIASKGYANTLMAVKEKLGYKGNIQVYNQGGFGIAEAVDEEPDYIDRKATALRANYRGPSLDNAQYRIDKTLMDIYNFDFDKSKMLCDSKNVDDCNALQINSADNYVRYHLVSMMENIRKTPGAQPLKAILLGCTHYPYLTTEISTVLDELYNYQRDGEYLYRPFMVKNIELIDPAVNVAEELYVYLKEKNLLNKQSQRSTSEFYITVPNRDNPEVITDSLNYFPYDYKYGRNAGNIQEYVKVVPFSKNNISPETIERLRKGIPTTFTLITHFARKNEKLKAMDNSSKIIE